ncbi:predicted protein [Methanosarcina acetivorans C2A]|uniref:Uncharacterized protein n=2 Tax=Methanosarcina acetivorans TaxID=2214 RepID=Q8TSP2_METAC|nr:predicted protein [Methanosarcina acetivorans C2A]
MTGVLDKLIPKQRKMSTRVGGMLTLVGEAMFLFSILNFLMISRLQYYSEGDSYIRTVFPHYLLFLAGLGTIGFVAMWMVYVYVLPSKQRFSQEQAVKDNRSPMYDRILEVQDELAEMRKMIKELSEKVEKLSEKDSR